MPDVETVWGAISPEDLGITMMHEHTLCDLRCSAKEPAEASMKKLFARSLSRSRGAEKRSDALQGQSSSHRRSPCCG